MDVPDLYADGVSISVGPYGFTLTFLRSTPSTEVGEVPVISDVILRVRASEPFAREIASLLNKAIASKERGHSTIVLPEDVERDERSAETEASSAEAE